MHICSLLPCGCACKQDVHAIKYVLNNYIRHFTNTEFFIKLDRANDSNTIGPS